MKKLCIIFVSIPFMLFAGIFQPSAVSPRKLSLGQVGQHRLSAGNFEIVNRSSGNAAVAYAAQELADYLGLTLGGTLTVLTSPSGKLPVIYVGGDEDETKNLDRDGFIIRSSGGDIVIAGHDEPHDPVTRPGCFARGTLFGVYDFLERFAGVRFFFPGEFGTVVQPREVLEIPSLDIADRPDMQYRALYLNPDPPQMEGQPFVYPGITETEMRRLIKMRCRSDTMTISGCHGLAYLGYVQRFAKSNPEYFALRANGSREDGQNVSISKAQANGHLCFSSPGLRNEVYLDAAAFLTGQPASSRNLIMPNGKSYWSGAHHLPFFSIMPNDAMPACHCPNCKATLLSDDQARSDFYWDFFIDIAQRLKAAKIPGYVTTMSYHPYHLIPQPDIPDNLIIELAMSGAWQEGNPGQAEADERLRAWVSKLKAKTYVWTYQNKQHLPWIPNYAPHAVGSFYQRQAPYIFGTFYEGENDIWLYSYLNYYIAGKVLWNSNADVDALIEEHHQLMFGPGANEMKQFFSALESKWMRQVVGNVVNTSLGPTVVRPPEHQLWGNIYSSEFLEEAEKLFATAASKAAAAPDAKKRIIFLRDNYLGPMQEGLRRYHGRISERDDWQGSFPAITAAERPVIDGKIDEQAWFKAEPLWLNARYNTKIEVATRGVRCRDQENLYFAFICDEPFTSAMAVAPSRSYDDVKIWQDNSVEILLDTEGKRQFHHQFIINSNGVWSDLQSKHRRSDFSWDCPAEVKTSVVPGVCWQAEVRIPIQALPAMTRTDRVYANFTRIRMLENENIETILYSWCRVAEDHRTEEFGVLSFEPVEDDNQLSDGDFAAPLSPDGTRLGQWVSSHKINRDTDYYKTAGASLRFDGSGSGTIRQWFKPLKPETTWELSFYLRMEDVGPDGSGPRAGFYARINDSGREAHYLPKIPLTGSMPWTRLSYRFTTSKLSDWPHSTIDFNPYRVNGKIWLDRVAIREVQPDR